MLEHRVCIVCGGGGSIGEETAVVLADAGATVVVNDLGVDVTGAGADDAPAHETVDRIEDAGGEAMVHVGDVTDIGYTARLVEETVAESGAVHAVANFAGALGDRMLFKMEEAGGIRSSTST